MNGNLSAMLVLTKGLCSKRYTLLSVSAVHQPFYISISAIVASQAYDLCGTTDIKIVNILDMPSKQLNY